MYKGENKKEKKKKKNMVFNHAVCPRSGGPFYMVTCYITWVTTSRTDGIKPFMSLKKQMIRQIFKAVKKHLIVT